MKPKRDETRKKHSPKKSSKKPDVRIELSIIKRLTLFKVMSQIAVAFIGGAANPITAKVIKDYERAHLPTSQVDTRYVSQTPETDTVTGLSETDNLPSPLCEYRSLIKMKDGTEINYEFRGYDEQLCNGLAGEIIYTIAHQQSPSGVEFDPTNPFNLSSSPTAIEPVSSGDVSLLSYGEPYMRGVYPAAANPFEKRVPEVQPSYGDMETLDKLFEEWDKKQPVAEVLPAYSPSIQLDISPYENPVYLKMNKNNIDETVNLIYPNIPGETQDMWADILRDKLDSISSIHVDRKELPGNYSAGYER